MEKINEVKKEFSKLFDSMKALSHSPRLIQHVSNEIHDDKETWNKFEPLFLKDARKDISNFIKQETIKVWFLKKNRQSFFFRDSTVLLYRTNSVMLATGDDFKRLMKQVYKLQCMIEKLEQGD